MRWEKQYQNETATATDGDKGFIGVYEKGEPDKMPPGFVREARNIDFDEIEARPRKGSQTPTSLQPPENPTLFGSGIYSDPRDVEWLLLASRDGVWRVRDGATPRLIPTPELIDGAVTIVQAFTQVLMFRGADKTPWVWDGVYGHEFEVVSQTPAGDGTAPIPNGPDRFGLRPALIDRRLIIPHGRSELAGSDIDDYLRYDAIFADFNVTGGNDDTLTGLFRLGQGALLIGNTQSVQQLIGVDATLENLQLAPVNDQLGVLAGATLQRLGNDVLWLSDEGVFTLSEVEQRKETAPTAVSEPILRTIARINFREAVRSIAAVHGKSYYLAVPIDGSSVNNAILPYSSVLEAWQGVHVFPAGVQIDAFHRVDWLGKKRLHFVDYANGRVHLLYEGRFDYVGNDRSHVSTRVKTRGYSMQTRDRKRFRRGKLLLKTWAPRFSGTLETDGVNESTEIIPETTKDRTQNMYFGQADYDPSNVNDDHAAPGREDYSVDIGTAFDPDDAGIDFSLEQEHPVPFTMRDRGRYAMLTVENSEGSATLSGVQLEGAEADRADIPRA